MMASMREYKEKFSALTAASLYAFSSFMFSWSLISYKLLFSLLKAPLPLSDFIQAIQGLIY